MTTFNNGVISKMIAKKVMAADNVLLIGFQKKGTAQHGQIWLGADLG